jgi:23S rRNA pseudouridine955/2504/2580 synthase
MFLHAWRLRLRHPLSNESMELHAQLPQELQEWVASMQRLPN